MAVDQAIREHAENLYVYGGLNIVQVAQETEISERTVANWSSEGGWTKKRREYRQARSEIKRYTLLTQLKLIKDIHEKPDSQKIYAFESLVRASKAQREDGIIAQDTEQREIRTPQEAIDALQEAVERKLNMMLSDPNTISLSGIKDMKKAMELVEELKAQYDDEPGLAEEGRRGLSDKTVEEIKKRILGI